jgi:flagellar basal-body rod protein FlgG
MIKGLYRSASAMVPRIKMQEITANNLANASSAGFKRDMLFTRELSRAQAKHMPRRSDWETPMIDQVYTEYEPGTLEKTDNPLDLAIEGDGFFVVETESGDNALTRSGSFTVSPTGFLINADGHRLLSDGGPISVGNAAVSVAESGQIEVNGGAIGNLRIMTVPDRQVLKKIGDNEFITPDDIEPIAALNYAIRQGYLESSNVNAIKEMVNMIISFRNYEADAQSLKTQDETLEKLIDNVGRVR